MPKRGNMPIQNEMLQGTLDLLARRTPVGGGSGSCARSIAC